jgi:hypothetical protein
MDNIISEYQKWKHQGEGLRTQARQAMEQRFRELMAEAVQIAEEYQEDFGKPLKPVPPVTTFRFKSGAKAKSKKTTKAAAPAKAAPKPDNPKVKALEKRLEQAKKKLEATKASGGATKNLEDRIYELEDELRLTAAAS